MGQWATPVDGGYKDQILPRYQVAHEKLLIRDFFLISLYWVRFGAVKSQAVFIWNDNSSSHFPNGRILIPDFS